MIILPAGYSGKLVSERPFHFENFFFAFIAPICGFSPSQSCTFKMIAINVIKVKQATF